MPRATDKKSRCQHRMACGRRCRKPIVAPKSRFCQVHEALTGAQSEPDLSSALAGGLGKFTSPGAVNKFLSRLLLLLSENRISPRRAAVLAYITNQLLRTIAVMEQRDAAPRDPKKPPVNIIWQIPGPPREYEPDPVPQPAGTRTSPATAVPPAAGRRT